ncbi:hypothetical protein E4P41_11700 [Geodermatophilus sp. DF01-2]|uniref:hypothetical protein n=1 Tax=Geodermatophilus sp. DF01-2 TaxID=2559610 RepID=UPI0010747C64|nr:hypothetical protein [Geodermatophilus sp. DF01_2]TFV59572.1 hypothetical protein E4P41_11700 [Geodermatophilus sp. DF01_2]
MRRTLLPAAAVLFALTSCAADDSEILRTELAAVLAEEEAPIVPDPGEGEGPLEEGPEEPVLEPVEVTTELVDPEGTVVGAAWLRDGDQGVEVQVEVNGLASGFHTMGLYDVGECGTEGPPADDSAFSSVGELLTVLPPVLVLDTGVGELTTLVAPAALLEELIAGNGTAVVVGEPVGGVSGDAPGDLPGADQLTPPTGSLVACAAFGE